MIIGAEKLMSDGICFRKKVRLMDLMFMSSNSKERRYEFVCDWRIGDNHGLHRLARTPGHGVNAPCLQDYHAA